MKDKFKILSNLDLIIACIFFVILVAVTFFGVIMRYFLSDPLHWTEEVQLGCFLWISFLGAGAAFRYGSHVSIEIVYDMLPKKYQLILSVVNYVFMTLLFVYLSVLSFELVQIMFNLNKATYILQIPTGFINMVVPISCVIMIVSSSVQAYREIAAKRIEIKG